MKTPEELARQIVDACVTLNADLLSCMNLAWPTSDIAKRIRDRDRAVRAALLEELADEEHAAGWEAAIEHRWRVVMRVPDEALRVTRCDFYEARRRERGFRRRAAAERGDDHA